MGFFLTDAIQSAFTPPGQNRREGIDDRNSRLGNSAADLWDMLIPAFTSIAKGYPDMLKGATALDNQRKAALIPMAGRMETVLGDQYAHGVANRAGTTARDAYWKSLAEMSPTMNPALESGYKLAAANTGARAQADTLADELAPGKQIENVTNAASGVQGIYGSLMNGPQSQAVDQMLRLASFLSNAVYGQPATYVGQGLASVLGNAAGQYAGAAGAKLGGKV